MLIDHFNIFIPEIFIQMAHPFFQVRVVRVLCKCVCCKYLSALCTLSFHLPFFQDFFDVEHFQHLYWILLLFLLRFFVCEACGMSSLTRDWIYTVCIGRKRLNHWTNRKVRLFTWRCPLKYKIWNLTYSN